MKRRGIIFILLAVMLLTAFTAGCGRKEESPVIHGKTVAELMEPKEEISYGGVSYVLRENITSCLFMCTEETDAEQMNGGQANVLFLLVADGEQKTYTLLQLDRNTVCTVDILGADNEPDGSDLMRLGLAHTYGDGGEASCENTVRAVSRLLLETPVDGYVAMQADALPLLADAVGGVTFAPGEDASLNEPEGVQSYLRAIGESLQGHGTDISFYTSLYETVKGFVQSDLPVTTLYKMLTAAMGYRDNGVITPEGTIAAADGHEEFYPDEDALAKAVLSLFYEEKPAGT